MKADLKIVERESHGMLVNYAKPGLDATISEGSIDFKFENTRNYPIRIDTKTENGTVTVEIVGKKEADERIIELESEVVESIPYKTIKVEDSTMLKGTSIVVQTPANGCISKAYKVIKDENGKVISKEMITKDTYVAINQKIRVGTKEDTTKIQPAIELTPIPNTPTPVYPINPTVKPSTTPPREIPYGWDSPESPYRD